MTVPAMSFPSKLLSRRRLLACLSIAALLFGLAMLHPYPRQTLFGPTIDGKPWCVWEDAIRRHAGQSRDSVPDKFLHWLGVARWTMTLDDFDHPELAPLLAAMLDDADPEIRDTCMSAIIQFPSLRDRSAKIV